MKKLLLIASLLIPYFAYGEQIATSSFVGIDNNDNSLIIGPEYAQDALNVNVTPGGKSVIKRNGYGIYKTLGTSQGVHGGFHFFDTSGNDVQVWGSSTSIYATVSDAAITQIVSSMTLNSTIDCADAQGSAYCVSSNRDFYIKTNGATLQKWSTSPLGTIVETLPDRVVVAGVSGTANTIYHSATSDFTNFTTGLATTDPFTEPIAAPGSKITHLRWACGKLLWWKDQSFGYETFEDQYSVQIKIISDNIGTNDNTSALDPGGNVWFRGQNGHIYKYDCGGLTRESIEITPFIQASGRRTANAWSQLVNSDFSAGLYNAMVNSTDTVVLQTNNAGSWDNRGFENSDTSWSGWTIRTGNLAGTTCTLVPFEGFSYGSNCVLPSGWTGYAQFINPADSTVITQTALTIANTCAWSTTTVDTSAYAGKVAKLRFINQTDTMTSSSTYILSSSTTFHYSGIISAGTGAYCLNVDSITTGGVSTISSGTYQSAVHNAPNLNGWGTLNVTTLGGTHAFAMRASSLTFTVSNSTPNWSTVSNNALISISTGSYFQIMDTVTLNTAANGFQGFDGFTGNWFEGSASDQAYGIFFDDAIWFSVAYGAGVSSNTYILRHDLINKGWTVYNFGAGGMLVQNNSLYFGDVSTGGNTFKFGSGSTDNGSTINAYWRTKTFSGTDPFLENSYLQLDSYWARNASQTGTVSYTVNGSTTSVSYTVNLSNSSQSLVRSKKSLPTGTNGSTLDIKFSDNSSGTPWELFLYRFIYNTYPYRPG